MAAVATVEVSHLESFEKIFQKLEQESERRAQELSLAANPTSSAAAASRRVNRDRRRTSISISRFGQLDNTHPTTTATTATFSLPTPPLTATSQFYSQQYPHSTDSLASTSSDDDEQHQRESDHVTQVQRIAARHSISRSVGGILTRTLTRSRSKPQLVDAGTDVDVVIGVVVEEAATVEEHPGDVRSVSRAMVYADAGRTLRTQPSRFTISGQLAEKRGIVGRAKEFFRARSRTVVEADRA